MSLPTRQGETNRDLIEALEKLLEKAQTGQIVSIAYATVGGSNGSTTATAWTDGSTRTALLSSVTYLQFRMLQAWDQA